MNEKCEMLIENKEYIGIGDQYFICDRPAKYTTPECYHKDFVCGIHKNEINRHLKAIGLVARCKKTEE